MAQSETYDTDKKNLGQNQSIKQMNSFLYAKTEILPLSFFANTLYIEVFAKPILETRNLHFLIDFLG